MYFDDVYRYLLSLSGSESTAEELTSETFFRAMDALDRFRGECSVRVWLCQIAKNLYYSQLRREKCLAPLEDCRIAEESHEEELEDHSEARNCCTRSESRTRRSSCGACTVRRASATSARSSARRKTGHA